MHAIRCWPSNDGRWKPFLPYIILTMRSVQNLPLAAGWAETSLTSNIKVMFLIALIVRRLGAINESPQHFHSISEFP